MDYCLIQGKLPNEILELDKAVMEMADSLDLDAYTTIKGAYQAEIDILNKMVFNSAQEYLELKKENEKLKKEKTEIKICSPKSAKRQTFWADEEQWKWVKDFAYTKRIHIADVMCTAIKLLREQVKNENILIKDGPERLDDRGCFIFWHKHVVIGRTLKQCTKASYKKKHYPVDIIKNSIDWYDETDFIPQMLETKKTLTWTFKTNIRHIEEVLRENRLDIVHEHRKELEEIVQKFTETKDWIHGKGVIHLEN